MRFDIKKAKAYSRLDGFIPNPKLRLLDQVSQVICFKHYLIRTEVNLASILEQTGHERIADWPGERGPARSGSPKKAAHAEAWT
jgi:hypothetical protein